MTETLIIDNLVLPDSDFRRIAGLVYKHCGINLHGGKKELVRSRLVKRLRQGDFKTFSQYLNHVLQDNTGNEFSVLVDTLSTNLTSFFREPRHFQFLSEEFLPRLLKRKQNDRDFRIRAWSAGCSSGEEPYSMAITLLEAAGDTSAWSIKILATDISTSMLQTAQRGIYDQVAVEPVPAAQKHKYLVTTHTNGRKAYQVSRSLRDTVIFNNMNLMKHWPIKGPLDFIFCRNVMIYFNRPTQTRLVDRLWDLLDSGGLLFTGHSESLAQIEHGFDPIEPTIYMKP
jgi:chemotaxis protein methyltransferase CheR